MNRTRNWPWRWIAPLAMMGVLTFAVVALGMVSGGTANDGESTSGPVQSPPWPSGTATRWGESTPRLDAEAVPSLPTTRDPDVYAKAVAELIFSRDWHHHPGDYRAALHAGLDPEYVLATDARDAIIATLDARIPEPWLWERIVAAKQTNTFVPKTTWEPALASAPQALEEWPPGLTVRNVQGVQSLRYLDERRRFRTDQLSATVTVFIVCPPARDHCTLLGVPREVEQ